MDQYAEFRVGNVNAAVVNTVISELQQIAGYSALNVFYSPSDKILRIGVGGEDLTTWRTNLLAAIQARFGKVPDLDRFATGPSDMDPKVRVVTGRDSRRGLK